MILKIFIDTDEMKLKNGCAYTPSLLNRMMMTIILMTKNGAYRPILLNRVKDVNSRHCSSVATPNRHYLTSLDCLMIIIVFVVVMMIMIMMITMKMTIRMTMMKLTRMILPTSRARPLLGPVREPTCLQAINSGSNTYEHYISCNHVVTRSNTCKPCNKIIIIMVLGYHYIVSSCFQL